MKKAPENPIVHYHLGLALYKKDNSDSARIEFERALSLDDQFDGAEDARKKLSLI